MVALVRKNWFFAGSDDGTERTAAIYTLIGTAKRNGLNTEAICAARSSESLIIRSIAWESCCPGTPM
jgi:hypothetical protein